MKHNIRINGEVKEIDCELGSGLLDDNGREVFEGNIVKVVKNDFDTGIGKVVYHHGQFWLLDEELSSLIYCCKVTIVD